MFNRKKIRILEELLKQESENFKYCFDETLKLHEENIRLKVENERLETLLSGIDAAKKARGI